MQVNPTALRKAKIIYRVPLTRITGIKVQVNPFALRKAKIIYNFGLSECNRVNDCSDAECWW